MKVSITKGNEILYSNDNTVLSNINIHTNNDIIKSDINSKILYCKNLMTLCFLNFINKKVLLKSNNEVLENINNKLSDTINNLNLNPNELIPNSLYSIIIVSLSSLCYPYIEDKNMSLKGLEDVFRPVVLEVLNNNVIPTLQSR